MFSTLLLVAQHGCALYNKINLQSEPHYYDSNNYYDSYVFHEADRREADPTSTTISKNNFMDINQTVKKHYLVGTIDRFEGKLAVIKTEDGQEIKWPISNLPEDAEESSSVRLTVSTSKSDEEEREKLAKTLLNEILNPQQKDEKK